jgi:hypothetical protein
MKLILMDMDPDDWILGIRAAKYLKERFQKDAWLAYGEAPNSKEFYAVRNKASITVRLCSASTLSLQEAVKP